MLNSLYLLMACYLDMLFCFPVSWLNCLVLIEGLGDYKLLIYQEYALSDRKVEFLFWEKFAS